MKLDQPKVVEPNELLIARWSQESGRACRFRACGMNAAIVEAGSVVSEEAKSKDLETRWKSHGK